MCFTAQLKPRLESLHYYIVNSMSRKFRLTLGMFLCVSIMNTASINAQSAKNVDQAITEVYGNSVQALNQEQIAWIHNQYDRSEVRQLARKENEGFPLLSSVPLMTKYNSGIQKDDFSQPLKINPIKYRINFMNKKDQTFRIDGTDYVLFVKGKK